MNSCATGLSDRFFKVITPMGRRVVGMSIGKILIAAFLGWNLNIERGELLESVRLRPVGCGQERKT